MDDDSNKSYGDITPSTDIGRFAIAVYAILICNVMGGLLDEGRQLLETLCTRIEPQRMDKKDATKMDKKDATKTEDAKKK